MVSGKLLIFCFPKKTYLFTVKSWIAFKGVGLQISWKHEDPLFRPPWSTIMARTGGYKNGNNYTLFCEQPALDKWYRLSGTRLITQELRQTPFMFEWKDVCIPFHSPPAPTTTYQITTRTKTQSKREIKTKQKTGDRCQYVVFQSTSWTRKQSFLFTKRNAFNLCSD